MTRVDGSNCCVVRATARLAVALQIAAWALACFVASADGRGLVAERRSGDHSQTEQLFYSGADIESRIRLWRSRDASTAGLVSDYFLFAVWANPTGFFKEMSKHADVYSEWLESLPRLSFGARGDCINRTTFRANLVDDLQRSSDGGSEARQRGRLIDVLKSIQMSEQHTASAAGDWLQGGTVLYPTSDLLRVLPRWEGRDGAIGAEISDYFCQFVAHNPSGFLDVMAKAPKVFNDWVRELPDLSFATVSDVDQLECLRNAMIASLGHTDAHADLRDRLVARLKSTKVRVID